MPASVESFSRLLASGRRIRVARLSAGDCVAEVVPELGGMVLRVTSATREILASDDDEELLVNPLFRGRILFPFNDRIPGGRYTFQGRSYRLPVNSPEDGSAIHGLGYRVAWRVLGGDGSGDEARLRLVLDPERYTCSGYPFAVRLEVHYVLSPTAFSLSFSVRNDDDREAPFALGWHPYYRAQGAADDCLLSSESACFVPVDAALLPTGGLQGVGGTRYDFRGGGRIGPEALDIALVAPRTGLVRLHAGTFALTLRHDPALFRFLQLFVPPDRRSIAVEPVTAATNSFNIPELGLRTLRPGAAEAGTVRISLTQSAAKGL